MIPLLTPLLTPLETACTKFVAKAPAGVDSLVNQVGGYIAWGVGLLLGISVLVGIGSIVAGRLFGMQHSSKVGVISLVVAAISAVCLAVLPAVIGSLWNGTITC
ncbi:MAG: hypothetical protein LBR20_06525 [Propionibacteriaceae bacterium]|jgi:hypothetical protein|nr:hypothetical protein [Propionibacteriaceae bacterium]